MAEPSVYKSRTGSLSCTSVEFFNFTTDIRNFRQFIPPDSVKDWQATDESCSFTLSPMGEISMNITGKEPFRLVNFKGTAFRDNRFGIDVHISENQGGKADVVLIFSADFNPLLKMMASAYVDKFLESLIEEMEKFRDWNSIV